MKIVKDYFLLSHFTGLQQHDTPKRDINPKMPAAMVTPICIQEGFHQTKTITATAKIVLQKQIFILLLFLINLIIF